MTTPQSDYPEQLLAEMLKLANRVINTYPGTVDRKTAFDLASHVVDMHRLITKEGVMPSSWKQEA